MKVRNKYLLLVAAVWIPSLALALAAYVFVLEPQVQRGQELDVQIADVKNLYRVAKQASQKENQIKLEQTVTTLTQRVSDFSMPSDATADLAFELARLADETGVKSFSMKPRGQQSSDELENCDFIRQETIDLSFAGPFHEFATMLNAFERHHPALFVETFSIRRGQTETSEPQANMQLAVLVEKTQEDPSSI